MKNEDKLTGIMADLLAEVHNMRTDNNKRLDSLDNRLIAANQRLIALDKRLISVENQQKKTNLELAEVRISVMKLAHTIEKYSDHEKRIKKLEKSLHGH